MNKLFGVLVSVTVGAVAAYMLDPERGRSRRALARDKAVAATNRVNDIFEGKSRHWSNVARGYVAEARNLFGRGQQAAEDAVGQVSKRT